MQIYKIQYSPLDYSGCILCLFRTMEYVSFALFLITSALNILVLRSVTSNHISNTSILFIYSPLYKVVQGHLVSLEHIVRKRTKEREIIQWRLLIHYCQFLNNFTPCKHSLNNTEVSNWELMWSLFCFQVS